MARAACLTMGRAKTVRCHLLSPEGSYHLPYIISSRCHSPISQLKYWDLHIFVHWHCTRNRIAIAGYSSLPCNHAHQQHSRPLSYEVHPPSRLLSPVTQSDDDDIETSGRARSAACFGRNCFTKAPVYQTIQHFPSFLLA